MPKRAASLATKLVAVGAALLALALGSIALTLWLSWKVESGAAAVNEAGRLRMQTYRLAMLLAQQAPEHERRQAADALDEGLARLRAGDPARPLAVPWNDEMRAGFDELEQRWRALRAQASSSAPIAATPTAQIDGFASRIDAFVAATERRLADWTGVQRAVQYALVVLAVGTTAVYLAASRMLVLAPLARLRRAVARIGGRDFGARVPVDGDDEFGELARSFNAMAEQLQALYADLESRVAEKTADLTREQQRLAALYETSAFIARADTVPELADGFARLMRRIAAADAVAIRWADATATRYVPIAADGLGVPLAQADRVLPAVCGVPGEPATRERVSSIALAAVAHATSNAPARGERFAMCVPVSLHERPLGEIVLLYAAPPAAAADDAASMYLAMASHFASRMQSLRAAALEREAAVAEERTMLARELHDSIAQSLAFLKIQVSLLDSAVRQRDDAAIADRIADIDAGVRESLGDVRELLVHFRTRTSDEDIGEALRTTLRKFEQQTGIDTELAMHGHGLPLPADVRMQVLRVIQEALSNARKHAQASRVRVDAWPTPHWRFEVRDDGKGFRVEHDRGESHVGLRIMRERCALVGAALEIESQPGRGTCVRVSLSASPGQSSADA